MDQQISTSITSLPDEIITLILQNNNCTEIIRFGTTCKKFYDLVCNQQLLWKNKLKDVIPKDIFDVIENHTDKDWLQEVKNFQNLKQRILKEVALMSSKYYWRINDIYLEGVEIFFNLSVTNDTSYYYMIYILQQLVRKGNHHLNNFCEVKPYTLTDIYYARTVLCHLINTYLTVKWVQVQLNNELHPEFVVNFFVQWVDSINMHFQEEVDNIISNLATNVDMIILKQPFTAGTSGSKVKDMCEKGNISERKILEAITQVIYHQPHMAVTSTANLDTLDIVKVINNKCGNVIALGAIYQAVARRCGVCCNLIALPDHFFLEWRDSRNSHDIRNQQRYKIDLGSGELQQMNLCPFSGYRNTNFSTYRPDSLLISLVASFNNTMGVINNWYKQNASYLIEFSSNNTGNYNQYSKFIKALQENAQEPLVYTPIHIKCFHEMNRRVILWLIYDVLSYTTTKQLLRQKTVRRRCSRVKYAVGMICYQKRAGYVCVVRGWDLQPSALHPSELNGLQYGREQPFYQVVAVDQSDRYVAQENLIEVVHPTRLYHLEDVIAREFTHFNGFAYVPNNEKRFEYPEDNAYVSMYQNRADLLRQKIQNLV